jgi:hypothetical protein
MNYIINKYKAQDLYYYYIKIRIIKLKEKIKERRKRKVVLGGIEEGITTLRVDHPRI